MKRLSSLTGLVALDRFAAAKPHRVRDREASRTHLISAQAAGLNTKIRKIVVE